ncbi:hypothetical protein E6C60_0676 [Paenibacillus algicola]|uniref:1-(5-phosphoribosyl)-5-((5-phosphoribosylamino)methylideneamino)imidazole-4-carboxamide isomerase n=1 Tax=Paenibacillus algicola TaxID=2565926 RepID=A0A4P8XGN0_9BACL|nr:hypothetical protein E6C60_0676 [Paenibacillus algicola]
MGYIYPKNFNKEWRLNIDIKDGVVVGRETEELESFFLNLEQERIPVCLVDINASQGEGSNNPFIHKKLQERKGQYWYAGGVVDIESVEKYMTMGARGVIISSGIYKNDRLNSVFLKELRDNFGINDYIISVDFEENRMVTKGFSESVNMEMELVLEELYTLLSQGTNIQLIDVKVSKMRLQPNLSMLQIVADRYSDIFKLWYGGNICSWDQFLVVQGIGFSPTLGRAYLEGDLGLM